MVNKEIWKRSIELAEQELKASQRKDEELLYIPVLVKSNNRGEIGGVRSEDYTTPYWKENSKLIIAADMKKYK